MKPEVSSLLTLEGIILQSQRVVQLPTVLLGKIPHRENIKLLSLSKLKEGECFCLMSKLFIKQLVHVLFAWVGLFYF